MLLLKLNVSVFVETHI